MRSDDINLHGIKRLAIMGGTFDPIHFGHLSAAEAVRSQFKIEKVIFIPTGKPPHKATADVSADEHRYMMTALATLSNPYFEASRMEIKRPGVSYTVDTLNELHTLCGDDTQIFFVVGADTLNEIVTWKNANELFSLASFIAVTRPGHNVKKQKSAINDISEFYGTHIYYLEIPAFDISSTSIRNRIRTGNSVKYLLPEEVERYIYKNNLYQISTPSKNEISNRIKTMLSENRFIHTEGVAAEAAKLAVIYDADVDNAYLAGLLHDCAKEISGFERDELIKNYNIKLDSFTKKSHDLAHGIIGAKIAENEFGITDEDMLNAIRYHTTGRKEMCVLEKILFLADIIEPNREPYPEYKKIKEMAYVNLDKAVYLGLKMKIRFLTERNKHIHPMTPEAYEYYK